MNDTDNDSATNSERQGWNTLFLFNYGGGSPTPAAGAGSGSLATQAANLNIGATSTNVEAHPDWWSSGTSISLAGTTYVATFMPLGTITSGDTFAVYLKKGTTTQSVTITANSSDNTPTGIVDAMESAIATDLTDTFFESTSITVQTNSDYNTNVALSSLSTKNPVVEIFDAGTSIPAYKVSSTVTSSSGATFPTTVSHDSQLNFANPGVESHVLSFYVSNWVVSAPSGSVLSMSPKDGPGYDQSPSTLAYLHSANPFESADPEFDWQGYNQNGVFVDSDSDSYWNMVNELAQYVLENEGSKKLDLVGLAYASTSQPPSFPMEPNVIIETAPLFQDTPDTVDEQVKINANHGAIPGVYQSWSLYAESGNGNPVPLDFVAGNVENEFALFNDDHVFVIEGEATAAYGSEMPGYLMAGQFKNNPATANATTLQNMLANSTTSTGYYPSLYGPAAVNMEDYTVLFEGSAADPNLASPPTQMTFDGFAYGSMGEPVGAFDLPTTTPAFNIVASDDLALQQALTYVNNADNTLSTALSNGSINATQYNTYQYRVDQIRMYDHFMFLEYQLESDYYGMHDDVTPPAVNSANFNTIVTDLTNVASWVDSLVTTDLVDTTNFDSTTNFELFAYDELSYYWGAGTALDTTLLNKIGTVSGNKAEPTQTVLNGDWTTDEAALAISAPPTNLAVTIVSSAENDLTWTNNSASPATQTGLNIYRSTDDVNFTLLHSVAATATSYHDTSITTTGVSYYYEVQSFNTSGSSIFNGPVGTLAAPTALSAVDSTATQINLTWTDNDAGAATAYDIDRASNSVGAFTLLGTVGSGATAYSDLTVLANTTYYYEVEAVNPNTTSAFSNIANAATLPAPSSLTAAAASSSAIDLTWVDNDAGAATAYDIDRSTISTGGFLQVGTVSVSATAYTDSGLTASTTYYYEVEAVDTITTSAFSSIATATTSAGSGLGTPSGLAGTPVTASNRIQTVDLTWVDNSDSGATGYDIDRSTTSTGGFTQVGSTTGAATTAFTDTSPLYPDTTYYYEVEAVNATTTSAFSNIATVAVPTNEVGGVVTDDFFGANNSNWSSQWTQTNQTVNAVNPPVIKLNIGDAGKAKFTKNTGTMSGNYIANINTVNYVDSYQSVLVSSDTNATGFELAARAALTSDTNGYFADLTWNTTSSKANLEIKVGSTVIGSLSTAMAIVTTVTYDLEFEVVTINSSQTQLYAKVWVTGTGATEPTTWQISTVDSTGSLQNGNSSNVDGMNFILANAAENTFVVDNYEQVNLVQLQRQLYRQLPEQLNHRLESPHGLALERGHQGQRHQWLLRPLLHQYQQLC